MDVAEDGSRSSTGEGWTGYLQRFHGERSGITEDVLVHALDTVGRTPYDWLADAVPSGALVLDLACGNGAMRNRLPGNPWLGLDLSAGELRLAHSRGLPVAQADAGRLPLPDESVDVVVVSMALMLLPLPPTLREIARVLRPAGLLVATVPVSAPLPLRDLVRYTRLCVALRHRGLAYPGDQELTRAGQLLAHAGLELVDDQRQSFTCQLRDEGVANQLLASLYLPEVRLDRFAHGSRVVHRWVGSGITTPVRRIIATRPGRPPSP